MTIASSLRLSHRVLYVGDHDLAGNDIEANTRRVLEQEAGEQRLVLSGKQVEFTVYRGY